jgi:hypothetical protein
MIKTPPQQKLLLPPLESGDRLNRYEFERRYNAMPHLKKAELIEGVVYMAFRHIRKAQRNASVSGIDALRLAPFLKYRRLYASYQNSILFNSRS